MTTTQPSRIRNWQWLAAFAAVVIGGGVLYFFNPAQHSFYPVCVFHKLTGLDCPGCGALRAMHQLSHGHILEAFRLNSLFVIALPFLLWVIARVWWRRQSGPRPSQPLLRPVWIWLMLSVVVAFGIVRNLPPPVLANVSP